MSKIDRVSASQVKDFQACARLWFFKSVLKQRPPQTEAQAKGTSIHAALESYLKGEPPAAVNPAEMAEYIAALKPLVDRAPIGTGVQKSLVEHKDEMETYPGGPKFVLVVDHAREVEIPEYGVIPQIDNLKTLSDFRYAKTPEELAKDAQMVAYAKWALVLFVRESKPLPNFVSIRHVYVRTRGKKISLERSRLMSPDEIETQWQLIIADIKAMVALSGSTKDPMAVMPNTQSCNNYGGCFFRTKCHGEAPRSLFEAIQVEEKLSEIRETKVETKGKPSILERLRAQQGGGAPAPAPQPAAAPAKVIPISSGTAPVAAPAASARVNKLRAAANATPASPAPAVSAAPAASAASPAPAASATSDSATVCGKEASFFPGLFCMLPLHTGDCESTNAKGGKAHWSPAGFGLGKSENWKPLDGGAAPAVAPAAVVASAVVDPVVAQVLPPDAPPREQPAAPAAAAAPVAPAVSAAPVASGDAPAAVPQPIKRRGRPPGSKNGANAAAAATTPPVIAASATAEPAAPAAEVAAATETAETTESETQGTVETVSDNTDNAPLVSSACPLEDLYVDCVPVKGVESVMLGETLIAMLNDEIASDTAKFDPSMKHNVGDWRLIPYTSRGALAQALRSVLSGMPKVLIVTSSTSGADVLIEVLSPIARRVVRALRG